MPNFDKLWNRVLRQTSLHGFYEIHHSKPPWNIWWTIILILATTLAIWSTSKDVLRYLQYNVKTTITTQKNDSIDFPSITFCHSHFLMKSVASKSQTALMAEAILKSNTFDEAKSLINMNFKKFYTPNNEPNTDFLFSDKDTETNGSSVAKYTIDSLKAVKKCWWNKDETKCDELFFNQWLDSGLCFTFNPNIYWLEQGLSNIGYGFNLSQKEYKVIRNIGPNFGLKLLMSVNVTETCCASHIYEGLGFLVKVHSLDDATPLFYLDKHLKLSPGFEYSILIKPLAYVRRTAHLGKCIDNIYVSSTSKEKFYSQNLCLGLCFLQKIRENCNCTLWFSKGTDDNPSDFGMEDEDENLRPCCWDDMENVKNVWSRSIGAYSQHPQKTCPECKQGCVEDKYDYQITIKSFPSNTFFRKVLLKSLNSSLDISYVQKNYLVVQFFLESLTYSQIVETQAITVTDVLMCFGAAISLYLGMSFMSPFEYFIIFLRADIAIGKMVLRFVSSHRKLLQKQSGKIIRHNAFKMKAGGKVKPIQCTKIIHVKTTTV